MIKDTNHFLCKIEEINRNGILKDKPVLHVTFDIVAMFPSISKSFGVQECRKHLDRRENKLFSTDCITEALEITLDNNLTEFNGVMVDQRKGTAIGP